MRVPENHPFFHLHHVLLESTSAFSLPSSVLSGPHAPLLNRAMDMREGQIPMLDSALLSPAVLLTCYHENTR